MDMNLEIFTQKIEKTNTERGHFLNAINYL